MNPYVMCKIDNIKAIVANNAVDVRGDVIVKKNIILNRIVSIAKNIVPNDVTFLYKKYIDPGKNAYILNLLFDFE